MSVMLRSARGLSIGRGMLRMRARALSGAVDLKGIGQTSDLADAELDGKVVLKTTPVAGKAGDHPNLPSLPPKLTVDWSLLADDLDEEAKKEVFAVKAIIDREQREVDKKREELTGSGAIDWGLWEQKLSKSPNGSKLMEALKAELSEWSFDPSAANTNINMYRDDLKEMASLIAAEKVKLQEEIAMLKDQEAALEKKMANVKSVTIAELMEEDPEMAMEVEEEIRGDNWSA